MYVHIFCAKMNGCQGVQVRVCVCVRVCVPRCVHYRTCTFSLCMFMRGGMGWGMKVAGESVVGFGGCGFKDVMCLYVCIDVS
jgi:hypothetical protein